MFDIVNFSLAAAVANDGTVTVGYPSGRSQGDYDWAPAHHKLVVGGNSYSAPADFTLTFNVNASDITLTNKSGGAWPISSACILQIERPGQNDGKLTPADTDRVRQIQAGLYLLNLGSPDVADPNGFCESQDLTAAGVFSVDTTAAAAIAAAALAGTADVPRNVVAAWTGTAVLTVTGTDEYGTVIVESSASGTSLTGKKAFKTVTGISTSANITALTVGTGDVLGLPVAITKVGQILAEFKDGAKLAAPGGKFYMPFTYGATQINAGTGWFFRSPVAGNIVSLGTAVEVAFTTGGDLTVKVGATDVDGLTVSVGTEAADELDFDAATVGHASTAVAVGDLITILGSSGFDSAGIINGIIEIDVAHGTNGTFVASDGSEATATTGDVRGTYDPTHTCDGDDGYMLLVAMPDPSNKGVAQYGG